MYDKKVGKWINQMLTMGFVVIFDSLFEEELLRTWNKERNITTKHVVSV